MLFYEVLLCLLFLKISCTTRQYKRVHLNCHQIRAFVDGHNYRRYLIAQGSIPCQPAASNMKYMSWDEELAEKAARWAEHGVFGHNPNKIIWSRRWPQVGENIHQNNFTAPWNVYIDIIPDTEEALDGWFNEHKNYGFEPFHIGTQQPIGHYTQLVWANSTRVGCGVSQRKEINITVTLFVCNYGPTGNYLNQVPYARSAVPGDLTCPEEGCGSLYGRYC